MATVAALEGYKLVRVRKDGVGMEHFYSYYDGVTEYRLGETATQTAKSDHSGGYYMYVLDGPCDPENVPTVVSARDRLAVLRVRGEGKRVRYRSSYRRAGKYSVSALTPVAVERYL